LTFTNRQLTSRMFVMSPERQQYCEIASRAQVLYKTL
jgi:hypothetical protein